MLPKDYTQFITEVGDGGAEPGYGIYPFGDFTRRGKILGTKRLRELYRYKLSKSFTLEPLPLDEAKLLEEEFGFAKEAYEKNPEKYFVNENIKDDGFWILEHMDVNGILA